MAIVGLMKKTKIFNSDITFIMPTKVSEKKLFANIILLVSSVVLLTQVNLFNAPVRVSEKGLAMIAVSVMLMMAAVGLLKRAFVKA